MALTTDELRSRESAKLETLIADLMAAVWSDSTNKLDDALENVVNFSMRTPFPELQTAASNARNAASSNIAKVALEELARISDRASAAGASFKAAAIIAENGKKELLFPSLAATAARGLELLHQYEEEIDSVSETVDNIDELGDVPDAVQDLIAAFENLKSKVKVAEAASGTRSRSAAPASARKKKTTKKSASKKKTKKKAAKKKTSRKKRKKRSS